MVALENEQPHKSYDLELETTLDDIPDGVECPACGTQTEKAYTQYHFGTSPEFRVAHLAGYTCPYCRLSTLSPEATLEASQAARSRLLRLGKANLAKELDSAIKRDQELVSERTKASTR